MSNNRDQRKPITNMMVGKLPNRRIFARLLKDGTIQFNFKCLKDDRTIGSDSIRLSPEAITAMEEMTNQLYFRVAKGTYDTSRLSKKEWQALYPNPRPTAKVSFIANTGGCE